MSNMASENKLSQDIEAALRLLEEHEAEPSAAKRHDLSGSILTAHSDPRPLLPAASHLRRRKRGWHQLSDV